jgi:hypothetical protein
VIGTTIGTLLGFATKKVFDVFRENHMKPTLDILFSYLFNTLQIPDTELLSVLIEYIFILVRFLIFPVMSTQIIREEKHKENARKHTRELLHKVEDIVKIL